MLNSYSVEGTYEGKLVSGNYIAENPEEVGKRAADDGLTDVKILSISPLEKITIEHKD